jgi:hypothetical protein
MADRDPIKELEGCPMQMTRNCGIGSALIILSILSWGIWTIWRESRTWCLVNSEPISVTQGRHFGTEEFASNLNAQYEIRILLDNRFPHHGKLQRLDEGVACSLGVQDYPKCTATPILHMYWKLLRNGKVIRQGDSDNRVGYGGYSPSEIQRGIGMFRVPKGRGYRIEVGVLRGDERLTSMRPRLSVCASDPIIESTLVLSYFLNWVCPCVALIGGLIVLGSFIMQRRHVAR